MQASSPTHRGIIDIGSNSVKLLVGAYSNGSLEPLEESGIQTRLAENLKETGNLSTDAIERTLNATEQFLKVADSYGAKTAVIATHAARSATNQAEFVERVHERTSLKPLIITGEQEAQWTVAGVLSSNSQAGVCQAIMDIGGGSTEFVLVHEGSVEFARSFKIGTVTLMEAFIDSDPPTQEAYAACNHRIKTWLDEAIAEPLSLVRNRAQPILIGTGGASLILARVIHESPDFDRASIENTTLSRGQVLATCNRLWALPLEKRQDVIGLPPERADVMLIGAALQANMLTCLNFESMRVSTRGLRFGAMLDSQLFPNETKR